MSVSLLIILIELVSVLIAGGGFLLFKGHKKKQAVRLKLKTLLRKVESEVPDRREKIATTFKQLGVTETLAEQGAERLVDAELNCVKKFALAQLNKESDDIAFFSDSVYELSAVNMDVGMLNTESMSSTPTPVATVVSPDEEIEAKADKESEAGKFDDDIDVLLDLEEPVQETQPDADKEREVDELDDDIEVSLDLDELEESDDKEQSSLNEEPKNISDQHP